MVAVAQNATEKPEDKPKAEKPKATKKERQAKSQARAIAKEIKAAPVPVLEPIGPNQVVIVATQPYRWIPVDLSIETNQAIEPLKFRIRAEDRNGNFYLHSAVIAAERAVPLSKAIMDKRVIDTTNWEKLAYPRFGSKADDDRIRSILASQTEAVKD